MSGVVPVREHVVNLTDLQALLVESNQLESDILYQVLTGFGIRKVSRARSSSEACDYLKTEIPGLILVGMPHCGPDGLDASGFTKWVRRYDNDQIRTAPIISVAGHTSQENVLHARDSGSNFIVAKPITPQVLFDRVLWLTRDTRSFIVSENYVGPDRRFNNLGPPPDTEGRRSGDLSLELGEASSPNLSQREIDRLMATKAAA